MSIAFGTGLVAYDPEDEPMVSFIIKVHANAPPAWVSLQEAERLHRELGRAIDHAKAQGAKA